MHKKRTSFDRFIQKALFTMNQKLVYKAFIIGGSWAAMQIQRLILELCEGKDYFDNILLPKNDLDILNGNFE